MNNPKQQAIRKLLEDVRADLSCERITPPLVNQFTLHKAIPNLWFDWENRANSPIMIIGQDWGPYVQLKKYIVDSSQDHFASSRTEKFIIHELNAISPRLINEVFFTVAVVFTRTGHLFRGNANYNESKSFRISFAYVSRQIDIVKPKIILTLGRLAFRAVDLHFKIGFRTKKLSEIVTLGEINLEGTIIIPAYHPAAFVDPKIQRGAWKNLQNHYQALNN